MRLIPTLASLLVTAAFVAGPAAAAVSPPTQEEPYIVFTMGDSYASGEGAPDIEGTYDDFGQNPGQKEGWTPFRPIDHPDRIAAERCHRSGKSPSGVATRYLNDDFPDLRVEWQSVACSGASIIGGRVFNGSVGTDPGGLLKPYRGQDKLLDFDPRPALPSFPPQVTQVDSILDSRREGSRKRIDALLMNIGGNDIGFASFVSYCANVVQTTGDDCHTLDALDDFREGGLGLLPGRYDRLAASINGTPFTSSSDPALGYQPKKVILTAVPDVARTSNSGFCDRTPAGQHEDKVKRAESEWLEENVKDKLNDEISSAADRHGWEVADQAVDDFRGHAICQSDNWINTRLNALRRQGEDVPEGVGIPFDIDFSSGWVHPNERGYLQTGGALYEKLAAAAVERFTPRRGPTVGANQRSDGFDVVVNHSPFNESTTSGTYGVVSILAMSANGTFQVLPAEAVARLLGYGDTREEYPGLTGRFVATARSCGPLSRDGSVGCGPGTTERISTLRPAAPVSVTGGGTRTIGGDYRFTVKWSHANALAEHDTQFARVSVSEVGRSARDGGFSTTVRAEGRVTTLTNVPGVNASKRYTVTVQACNDPGVGCSGQSAPAELDASAPQRAPNLLTIQQLQLLDPSRISIAGTLRPCSKAPRPFTAGPDPVLPSRPGTTGAIELPDTAGQTVFPCPGDPPVGRLSLAPRNARANARTRAVSLTLGWQHPRRWGELDTVSLRLRDGKRVLGTLTFDQEDGTVRLSRGSKVRLRGEPAFRRPARLSRAIKIKLALTLPRSAAGSTVVAEMAAKGDDGASQPFTPGGTIRVR